jgi:hypothetical protein
MYEKASNLLRKDGQKEHSKSQVCSEFKVLDLCTHLLVTLSEKPAIGA